jgi:hypothetical protein
MNRSSAALSGFRIVPNETPRYARERRDASRIVALMGDADERVSQTQRADNLGCGGEKTNDSHAAIASRPPDRER